ncbi:MAG: glycerate kinase [Nitrospirota bacterium]
MQIGARQPLVRAILARLLQAGLAAVEPSVALRRWVVRAGSVVRVGSRRYDLRDYDRVVAIGAGKASARLAAALEQRLDGSLTDGLVITKYGHAVPTRRITIKEAGHPVPDGAGLRATEELRRLLGSLTRNDLAFVLLSGGASSLLPAPAPGLTLADLRRTTDLLLRCGAAIREINAVRKHLSTIAGGRLAAATRARIVSLILSDVTGDDLGAIGSGPTAPDSTTYADASEVLCQYGAWAKVPARVRAHLLKGRRGGIADTPKPGSARFRLVHNQLIGNNGAAVEAAARAAARDGLRPLVLTTSLTGEAREAAKVFGALAREIVARGRPVRRPACLLAGGELTVTVRGEGRGGRAQEFALAAAREIAGLSRVWIAAFGTDGTDGPTDAAGAVVDGETVVRAARIGLDPAASLARSDAYGFFKRVGGHIVSGPTGTNVNDLYILIVL